MPKKRSGSAISKPGKKIRVGAVRIKDDPENTNSSSAGSGATATLASVKERLINLLSEPKYKTGASSKEMQEQFQGPQEQSLLVQVINELSRESRLLMSKLDNQLYYKLVDGEIAQKYQGLDVSAKMVLQVIEKAGNKGIWTKDIRLQTNIQQQALNKIFKQLETRHLIKPVKSVTAKAKKLYMLYELTPSKELTGGVWYSGLEFDHEFISMLRTCVMLKLRGKSQGMTLSEIKSAIMAAGVSRVELTMEEVKQLVQTLVFDYHIEENPASVASSETRYVASRRISTMCDFKWWDALSPDFHFRAIKFEDGVVLGPHELHHHSA